MTVAQLTALIKSADSRVTASNLTVIGTGPSVTILAEKSATASDRDLKIDAVFLAKALIEGSGGQVDKVKALFSQPDKPGRFAMVDKKVVEDYAGGKLTPEQLLGCVTLTPLEAEKAPEVVQGPLLERRLLIWQRIEKLRQRGTGVTTFQDLFRKAETSAQSPDVNPEALLQQISYLELKLTEQEGLVKQAQQHREGRGPKGTTSASSASSPPASSPVTSLAQPQPPHHQDPIKRTSPTWGGTEANNQWYPPPPPGFPPHPPGGGPPP